MKRREMTRRVATAALGVTLVVTGFIMPGSADTAKAATLNQTLAVKCQNLTNTTAETPKTKVRLVTGVDSLEYKKVGFEVKIGDSEVQDVSTTTVYSSIIAAGKTVTAGEFSEGSKYLAVKVLGDIPSTDYEKGIYIRPYVVTKQDEKVYGIDRYMNVCNGYDGSFNVAVRVSGEKEIGAGLVSVTYDNSKLEYVGYDGSLLKEVEVYDAGEEVRFVSNVEDVTKNVKADGILMNIRFRVKNYDAGNGKTDYSFNISKSEFCNVAEQDVTGLKVEADTVQK